MTILNHLVFIVGAPRSGPTLLQYMLRSHPNISLPTSNLRFIIPLYRNAEKFDNLREEENIRSMLEVMYQQSADFLDTDLHGIAFDIDRLINELFTEDKHIPLPI